jgi:protein TilB
MLISLPGICTSSGPLKNTHVPLRYGGSLGAWLFSDESSILLPRLLASGENDVIVNKDIGVPAPYATLLDRVRASSKGLMGVSSPEDTSKADELFESILCGDFRARTMKITEELLRKRSEHNQGLLTDLEEISLHQNEIEKIEAIGTLCRHLKILLLQNNIIDKIEGLRKLKELEYLNLALNNIQVVDNLDGCESLRKLDLTVNFIDLDTFRESILNLKANQFLEDLYLVGNPCMDWANSRQYVIAHLSQLKQLDGNLVTPSERIEAQRKLPRLEADLKALAQELYQKKMSGQHKPAYTREERVEQYRELAGQKEAKELQEKKRLGTEDKPPREIPGVLNAKGELRQCNEGKYEFKLDDWSDPTVIVFEVQVPKYLDTSLIDLDVNPKYIRCVIKQKVLQLLLPAEVNSTNSKVTRSRTTGILRVDMPVINPDHCLAPVIPAKPVVVKKPDYLITEVSSKPRTRRGDEPPPLEPIRLY